MQVTKHIHALKVPFPGSSRFVYAYLVYGEKVCLIDSGISSTAGTIFDYLEKTGRDKKEISLLVQTHSHPDHIGSSAALKQATGCRLAASAEEKPWIEDIGLQFRIRPTGNFHAFVQEAAPVDQVLRDGDVLDLGGGLNLKIIQTPGHSRGSICLRFEEDGALFSGDAVPNPRFVPIYEDIPESVRSIRRLQRMGGWQALFSSWHEPLQGPRVYEAMDEGLAYFQRVHEAVRQWKNDEPDLSAKDLAVRVLADLGFPESAANPNVVTSIEAHLREIGTADLLKT